MKAMSAVSDARPRRRATRRHAAPESDGEDSNAPTTAKTAAITSSMRANSTKQATRRTAHDAQLTPHARRKNRRTIVHEDSSSSSDRDNSASVQEPTATQSEDPEPSKQQPTDLEDVIASAPTLAPPVPPDDEPGSQQRKAVVTTLRPSRSSTPLVDITGSTNNEAQTGPVSDSKSSVPPTPISKPPEMPAEKPMDIVIRTRTKPASIHLEPAEPKPRLVITYLILTNFKSYAGRQEVGPFHASFSSVVGPNGSGKSNVIDSLLFVFGFRASKMRQGKISSLIHNSAAYPDLDHCEVQVHFEEILDHPNGHKDIMPNSSLIISRKAFRNNSSTYYINGSTSNFTEVTSLLRGRGIDLDHKRFLILQGEVESIAQMKPKAANEHDDGLLEYLEDIIGTSKYKNPIEEAATEVEASNEVCLEKNNRVQHVEKEKKSLEGKKDDALAYIQNENDLAIKQSTLCQIFIFECQDNIDVAQEAVTENSRVLEEEKARHQGHREELRKLEEECKTQEKRLSQIERAAKAASDQGAKADKEMVKLEERCKHHTTKLNKLEKALVAARSGTSDAAEAIKDFTAELERHNASMGDLQQRLTAEESGLDKIRQELQGKTQGLSDEIAAKQKLLEPTTQRINEKTSAIALAESELNILRRKENADEEAIFEVQARLKVLSQEQHNKQSQIESCKKQIKKKRSGLSLLEQALEKVRVRRPAEEAKVSAARQKTEEARASLSKSQNQGNVLTSLTRLKDTGRIDGFYGRLGNLGAIDKEYDIAISTACPALDNLVVESVETAQQCIEHLRKNNLGRANFICLDRLGQRDTSKVDTPEGTPRLFDLIRPKSDRFLPAFYSVMQNTLVASDLEQANRVAFGARRWRVVTIDGQLIDKSGTMSGGGVRVARGAMSSQIVDQVSKEQIKNLEAAQESEEKFLRALVEEEGQLLKEVQEANDEIPALEMQVQKATLELDSFRRGHEDLKKRQAELSSKGGSNAKDHATIAVLEGTVASLQSEIENLRANSKDLDDEIQRLQDKIMEAGGVRLRSQKAKVDGLREEIETLTEQLSASELGQTKAEKQLVKHERAKTDAEKEIGSIGQLLSSLGSEIEERQAETNELKRRAEDAENELHIYREDISALRNDLDKQLAEINEMRGTELEMHNQLEDHQKVLSENQKRLRYWEEKLSKLTIQSVRDLGEDLPDPELPSFTRDELADVDKNVLKGEIAILEERTQNATVELGVLEEYRRRVEEHAARSGDLAEAVAARDAAKRRCEELRRLRLEGFMEGFSTISLRLKEMYQMITMGGNAELELVDSLDPFSEGILFSVMPPKKSWKNISNLSGGEKTLSSLALVFALHHYKPTPLYVMDEIDAALDFRNVSIVASYIKERTKNAQFIVISLRNNMFELASRLVGVYKVNHMTKSVTVENRDYIHRTQQIS